MTLEDVGGEVDSGLARLPIACDAVVEEDDVRAPREPVPLVGSRHAANAAPESGIGGRPSSQDAHRQPCAEDGSASEPAEQPIIEPRTDLKLFEEGRIRPDERNRGSSSFATEPEERGMVSGPSGLAPHELSAGTPDAEGDRLGRPRALG